MFETKWMMTRKGLTAVIVTVLATGLLATASAQTGADTISGADTAWVLTAAAMVMLMVPGLALFYGGMVRHKNVLATLMQCFAVLAIVSLQWAVIGYSLAFGGDHGGVIGGFDFALLRGVGLDIAPEFSTTIPHLAFFIFQLMFAAITPALIVGAFAERMSFKALLVFSLLWATLVYDPVAHWVWAPGGFLRDMGALDFAGGTVVHITAGVAALACVLYMGHRKGFGSDEMRPHNIPLTLLGAGLLWFGWFGFNAGSALSAGTLAVSAFVATHLAAAAGALAWSLVETWRRGKPSALGAAAGVVAGLVAITPASGFVGPMGAIVVGLVAGVVCFGAVTFLKGVLRVDDSLDAFGVHGVGGVVGALLTGVLATTLANDAGADGLLHGGGLALLGTQATAVVATAAYAFIATWAVLKVTDLLVGLRVSEAHEEVGLDMAEHGEAAYDYAPHIGSEPAKVDATAALAASFVATVGKDR